VDFGWFGVLLSLALVGITMLVLGGIAGAIYLVVRLLWHHYSRPRH
jgi:hypothetical protein